MATISMRIGLATAVAHSFSSCHVALEQGDGPRHAILGSNALGDTRRAASHLRRGRRGLDGVRRPLVVEMVPRDRARSDAEFEDASLPEGLIEKGSNRHGE